MLKYIFILFFMPITVFAQDSSLISVEGLSFQCSACKKTDANYCAVPWQGKTLSVLCDSLFEVLLQKALEENSQAYPKNQELLTFISRKEIDSGLINIAFELLQKRQIDQKILDTAVDLLMTKHPEVISEGISKKTFNENVKLNLWSKRNKLTIANSFLLAKSLPGKGLESFFQDLSVVDFEQDSAVVTQLIENKISIGLESQILSSVLEFIKHCSQKINCEDLPSNFGPEATKYAYRLQNFIITNAIIEKKISGLKALSLLAKTKYLEHRTPETHQALLSLLTELGSVKKIWKKLSADERDFVTFMSRNDSRIAEQVYRKPGWTWFEWLIGVSCSVLASGLALYWFTRGKTKETFSETVAFKKDLEELNAIWSFFGLSPNSNMSDLKRRYREMARELHPDSGRDSSDEFVTLNDYYQRAIELLKQ